MNTEIDLKIKATSYLGLPTYGTLYIGDKAFEYYNDRNIKDYIIIPWEEIDYIAASVLFKGKWISRFAIFTKKNGYFTFSTKNNKKTLRAVSKYVDKNRLVRSKSFIDVITIGFKELLKKLGLIK